MTIKMNPYTKPSSIPLTPVFQTMKLWKHSILQLSFPPLIFRRHPLNLKGFPRNQIVLSARSRQSAPDTSPHHISGIFVRARIQIAHIMYTWFRFWGGKLVFSSGQFFSCPAGRILPSVTGGGAGVGEFFGFYLFRVFANRILHSSCVRDSGEPIIRTTHLLSLWPGPPAPGE